MNKNVWNLALKLKWFTRKGKKKTVKIWKLTYINHDAIFAVRAFKFGALRDIKMLLNLNSEFEISNRNAFGAMLLNRLFRRRSKKTSKLCVTGFCAGNSPLTGEFPAQTASYAEKISI